MTTRRWTQEEKDYLRAHYLTQSMTMIGKALGRSQASIRRQVILLGLSGKINPRTEWTPEQLEYLRQNAREKSRAAIASVLRMSKSAVKYKIKKLGLFRPLPGSWTREERNFLLFKCEKLTVDALARKLNRSKLSVIAKMRSMQLVALCGVYSLRKAASATGYSRTQLIRARDGLAMQWRRPCPHQYAITDVQLKQLCDYLRDEGKVLHVERPTRLCPACSDKRLRLADQGGRCKCPAIFEADAGDDARVGHRVTG